MKIGILSRNIELYSTQRLIEAGEARGHQVHIVDTLRCYMNVSADKPAIYYKGKQLKRFDAIIPRIGASITFYGTAILRQFEMMGVYVANNSLAMTRARDKLRSLQMLSRRKIGLPVTAYAHSFDDIHDVIKMVGGAPLIIKVLEGTQGIGVVLAESNSVAESVLQAFLGLKVNILAQEYIKEAEGADLRCLVIGDQVVAAMKRQALPGEFRSNLHRGGKASGVRLTKQEKEIAVASAKIMGLNIAGVDILRSKRGPLVMEVNASPGLEGIEKTTGKDIATMIIQFIEEHALSENIENLVQ